MNIATNTDRLRVRLQALCQRCRHPMRSETLALLVSLFFTLAGNGAFWSALMAQQPASTAETGRLLLFTGLLMTGAQWLLLLLVINRWTAKPLLYLLFFLSAPAVYFMTEYGIYFDLAMVRNIFETDVREASELIDWPLLPYLLTLAVLPGLLLWRIRIAHSSLRQALVTRATSLLLAVAMIAGGLWPVMDQLVPTFREHKELRHLVTPSSFSIAAIRLMFALPTVLAGEAGKREIIGADAQADASVLQRKPRAIILVVGETVRAANWGLNGYARQTTPQLAARDVLNFPRTISCGTDTATSLPCMFSLLGRAHYDENRIRHSESLLHVLDRAGVKVLWRDNQSGCKGVCDGLPQENLSKAADPELCNGQRCLDAILSQGVKERIASTPGDTLIVLHMLGNHGPAYYQRYPAAFRRFTPTCDTTNLASCSQAALINTYDNAILYTDHVLAELVDQLADVTSHDAALLFVSDHGESLGERNIYLHGMPYAIAPDEQTHVPMLMWFSAGFAQSRQLDLPCLARKALTETLTHDHLFHTVLSLFDVHSQARDATRDIMQSCPR